MKKYCNLFDSKETSWKERREDEERVGRKGGRKEGEKEEKKGGREGERKKKGK